jgi:hypothetical protein
MKLAKITLLISVMILFLSCSDQETNPTNFDSQELLIDISTEYSSEALNLIGATHQSLLFDGQVFEMINLPINIHLVYKSDGTGQNLSGTQIQQITQRLNSLYGPVAKVNFDICDIKTLYNTNIYNYNINNDNLNFLRNNHSDSDVINIYFVNDFTGANVSGFFYGVGVGDRDSFIIMDISYFENNKTLEHEIGHFFYLYHTHGNTNCGYTIEGDYVQDTPFDSNLIAGSACEGDYRVDLNCKYIGNDGYEPDTFNIMSYSRDQCRNRLSSGQLLRFGQVVRNSSLRGYLINNSCGSNIDCTDFYFQIPGFNPGGPGTIEFPYDYNIDVWINARLVGGVEPFEYKLEGVDNPNIIYDYQTSTIFKITESGRYALYVKDANGCITNFGLPVIE